MWRDKTTKEQVFVKLCAVYEARKDGLPARGIEHEYIYICGNWRYPVETFEELKLRADWVEEAK